MARVRSIPKNGDLNLLTVASVAKAFPSPDGALTLAGKCILNRPRRTNFFCLHPGPHSARSRKERPPPPRERWSRDRQRRVTPTQHLPPAARFLPRRTGLGSRAALRTWPHHVTGSAIMNKTGDASRQRHLVRRLEITAAVLLAHLTAGAWLAVAPAPMPGMESPEGSAINLSLANLAPADADSPQPSFSGKTASRPRQSQSSPAPPANPMPPEDGPESPVADPADDDTASVGALPWMIGVDEPCDMVSGVEARMQADPAVLEALGALPPNARSVANAVMLWDGAWTLGPSPSAALVALDQGLERALTGAPPGCLDAQVLGPRLVTLRDSRGATLLVIGSGEWRWSQLSGAGLPAQWAVK